MQRVSASYNKGLIRRPNYTLLWVGLGKILRVLVTRRTFLRRGELFSKIGRGRFQEGGEILITEALANNLPEIEGVSMTEVGLLSKNNKPYFKLIYE